MTETYEDIRDNSDIIPTGAREVWLKGDQAERMLRFRYERLQEDTDLTPEAKSRRAEELYEEQRIGIESKKQAAREALVKAAKSMEKNSVPRPQGEALSSTDPTKLLLDQNEAGRIVRTIERRKDAPGPFRKIPASC
jgi:hypothetical protein